MEELATYMRGWRGYFGFCQTPEVLIALTRWVRLRLRAALWREWKTPRRRRAALIANGVSEWAARNTAWQRPRSLVSRPQQSSLYVSFVSVTQQFLRVNYRTGANRDFPNWRRQSCSAARGS